MIDSPVLNLEAHVDGAMRLYATGDNAGAQALCRTVISVDPRNARALYLYGTMTLQDGTARIDIGKVREAVGLLRRAVDAAPDLAGARVNLGVALRCAGQLAEAVTEYEAAIVLDGENAGAHMNLGNCLKDLGRFAEAEAAYRESLRIQPGYALAYDNLGITLREQGKLDDAIDAFGRALELDPSIGTAYNNLGGALVCRHRRQTGSGRVREADPSDLHEALRAFDAAVRLTPGDAAVLTNFADAQREAGNFEEGFQMAREAARLNPSSPEAFFIAGMCSSELKRAEEAVEAYQAALVLRPEYAEARYNLAKCLTHLQRYDDAIGQFESVLSMRPDFVEAHNALGALYHEIVDIDRAMACYDKAIAIDPSHVCTRWNRGLMRLTLGDYERGFVDFELRHELARRTAEDIDIDPWTGEDLKGMRLLVRTEQGFGDTVQCVRFLPELRAAGARVTLECQPALMELLRDSELCDEVIDQSQHGTVKRGRFDRQVWLMSIPRILGLRFDSIPANVPYLRVRCDISEAWQAKLDEVRLRSGRRFLAGIVWAGSPKTATDHRRSIPLSRMEPLSTLDHVGLVPLQQGPGLTQAIDWAGPAPLHFPDPAVRTFVDTAAMIGDLDLVITVDTVVAHLAGALGRPVWLLIPYAPDWRWSLGRADSPWYPSMRIFRQSAPGDWDGVIDAVRQELTSCSS